MEDHYCAFGIILAMRTHKTPILGARLGPKFKATSSDDVLRHIAVMGKVEQSTLYKENNYRQCDIR